MTPTEFLAYLFGGTTIVLSAACYLQGKRLTSKTALAELLIEMFTAKAMANLKRMQNDLDERA